MKATVTASTSSIAIKPKRIIGLDIARALAVAGMATVHFATVLSAETMKTSSYSWIIDRLSGRPATIFMILAGIGISLRFAQHQGTAFSESARARRSLWKRGLFFLLVGYLNLLLWPGDILRVYGIAYLVAAVLVFASSRWIWAASIAVFTTFVAMMFVIDFETNWNFSTLDYANLWTIHGGVMNLFYNGFRAVLPWMGLLFIGMLIGRLDLRSQRVRMWLLLGGLLMWLGTEAVSIDIVNATLPLVGAAEKEAVIALLGTDSLPPMPLFLASSSGLALVVIIGCVQLTDGRDIRFWRPFVSAGQMAFTWYIAHIMVVMGAGIVADFRGDMPLFYALLIAFVFCDLMFAASWAYGNKFRYGPLEWVLRSVT